MPKKPLRSDDEEGFLRAFKDEMMDGVVEYGVRIEFHLCVPVQRPGLLIRGFAYHKVAGKGEQLYAWCEVPYPTHNATRLHAALYWAACKLNIAIRVERDARRAQDSLAHEI